MTDFSKWADEYLDNAQATKELIDQYTAKRRTTKSKELRQYYDHKIITLYDMYNDCMYSANELRRKAARIRERS